MNPYEFTLKYHVGDASLSMDDLDERLFEAGCNDALVAHSGHGQISLDFCRAAKSAPRAVVSAMHAIKKALPHAQLIEVKPDYVGVTDVANLFNVSRQYIQKLLANASLNLPPVTVVGNSTVYRLYRVIEEYKKGMPLGQRAPSVQLEELSALTMRINIKRDQAQLKDR